MEQLITGSHTTLSVTSDLALRNCLLTADVSVKIGDYGLSHTKYKVKICSEKQAKYANLVFFFENRLRRAVFEKNNNH